MALRKRGKKGLYSAYYWTVVAGDNGELLSVRKTVPLYTADRTEAEALERELMTKARAARSHQRALAHVAKLEIEAGIRLPEHAISGPVLQPRRRRLKVSDALETALQYRDIGRSACTIWRSFARHSNVTYVDQLTRELIFEYLTTVIKDTTGKTYNNVRSAIGMVIKLVLADAGMESSPTDMIPTRRVRSRSQRPFTDDEFLRIISAVSEPWRSAVIISWHTGMRQKDVFTLCWNNIRDDIIHVTPAKTSRFGRAVRIPIHPYLAAHLATIPRKDERVLGAWPYKPSSGSFHQSFTDALNALGIGDTSEGKACFNSLRNSFITRCDAAGVPRHALRGIVGHTSDAMTDLYSHDLESAKAIRFIPSPEELPKSAKNRK